MKIIWTLRYDPSVTAYLYSIRGTPTAAKLREAIRALQFKDDPTEGCRQVVDRPERYELEQSGHWIGIEPIIVDKSVRVLYIAVIS